MGPGAIYVISGFNGDTLFVQNGEVMGSSASEFGASVSVAGDVNNDGYSDVIVGSPGYDTTTGRAYVYLSCGMRGDVNLDGTDATVLDITYLVDFIFRGGPAPECDLEADVDGDGDPATVLDLTYLIDRIFRGGPPPPSCFD